MKTNTHGCDHKRIDAFLDSEHIGIEDPRLTDHLSICDDCRAYLESRAADSETWSDAAMMLKPTEFDEDSTQAFSGSYSGLPKPRHTALIRDVLRSLTPSEDPQRMGRVGEYEVTGVVGAGGMGVVLKAVDPSLDRVVAIKMMAPHLAHHGTARKRFEREAKAAAAVLHPNVVPIHSVRGNETVPYLVMAYIRGGSLQKRIDNEGPLPTIDILRIGSQVAAGLAAAHEQGLIHRDIKPENILLEEGVERVTITDFGLARTVDDASVTQTGIISGTPRYMSPEQARGESLDQQSDLFSLGSVLYAMCTGRPPFRGDTSYGVMRRITDETPTPIQEINPDIPDWLAQIVEKLMAKDKDDRYGSAEEVHKLLDACLSHAQQPTQTLLPASLRERQGPTKPRRGILPFLTSKHGVFTMIGLITAGILSFTASTLIGTATNTNTDPPDTKEVEKDLSAGLAPLQGDWKTFTVIDNGEIQRSGGTVRFHGNTMGSFDENGNPGESLPFEIDNSTDPKQIDLIEYKLDGGEDRFLGIYEIKGDTLKICFIEQVGAKESKKNSVKRPTTFEAPKGSKTTLIELRKAPKGKAAVPESLKPIQGVWEVTSAIENDREVQTNDKAFIEVKGERFTILELEDGDKLEPSIQLTAKADPTRKPAEIDLLDDKGRLVFQGIYKIEDGELMLCLADAQKGDFRPEAFAAPKGEHTRLLKLKLISQNAKPDKAQGAEAQNDEVAIGKKTTQFLVDAARDGNVEAVKAALKAGVNPNGVEGEQLSALHWAVAKRVTDSGDTAEPSAEMVKALIDAGANVNAKDYLGQTPLQWAATHASPEIVKMLIKAGANVNAQGVYGTPLLSASRVEIAKVLIDAGADVNKGEVNKPIVKAAENGNVKLIKLLIEKGATIDDPKYAPVLRVQKPEVLLAFIAAGARIDQRNEQGDTLLHLPLGPWHLPEAETVKLALEDGLDINTKNKAGVTPLHAAALKGSPEILALLIKEGATLDAKDKDGNTPLSHAYSRLNRAKAHGAVDHESQKMVDSLVKAGAKDDGRTPLQRAVAAGEVDKVKQLIASKADINAIGLESTTAMHVASEEGNIEIVKLLLDAGAKPDTPNAYNMRPLHLAANAQTAEALIDAGAKVQSAVPSPLLMATINGRADVVELMLGKADFEDEAKGGLLNWAVYAGHTEVVSVMLEDKLAKVFIKPTQAFQPLHVAASGTMGMDVNHKLPSEQKRIEIAKLLIESGSPIDARWGVNFEMDPLSAVAGLVGTTPLMFAAQKGEPAMVKFLLEQGADMKATNDDKDTALHFAAQGGHAEVAKLLVERNAKLNAANKAGKTPLDLTTDAQVKVYLIQQGAKQADELR